MAAYDSFFDEESDDSISSKYKNNLKDVKIDLPMTALRQVGRGAYERVNFDPMAEIEKLREDSAFFSEANKRQKEKYGPEGASNLDTVKHALMTGFVNPNLRGVEEIYREVAAGNPQFNKDIGDRMYNGRKLPMSFSRMPGELVNMAIEGVYNRRTPEEQGDLQTNLANFRKKQILEKTDEALLDPGALDQGKNLLGGATKFVANVAPFFITRGSAKQGLTRGTNAFISGLNRFLPNTRRISRVENVLNPRLAGEYDAQKMFLPNFAGSVLVGGLQGAANEDTTFGEGANMGAISGLLPLIPFGASSRIAHTIPIESRPAIRQAEEFADRTGIDLRFTEGNYGTPSAQTLEKKLRSSTGTNVALDKRDRKVEADLTEYLKDTIYPGYASKSPDVHGVINPEFLDQLRDRSQQAYARHGGGYTYSPEVTQALDQRLADIGSPHALRDPVIRQQLEKLRYHTDTPSIPSNVGPNMPVVAPAIPGQTVQTMLTDIDAAIPRMPAQEADALRVIRTHIRNQANANNPGVTDHLDAADRDWFAYNELGRRISPMKRTLNFNAFSDLDLPHIDPATGRRVTDDISNIGRVKNPKGENASKLADWDINHAADVSKGTDSEGMIRTALNSKIIGPNIFASSTDPFTRMYGETAANFFVNPKTLITGSPAGVLTAIAGLNNARQMSFANKGTESIIEKVDQYKKEEDKRKNPYIYALPQR